ncbi:MAG: bacillithiol system redox-active protein YtxJ [Flavobacteriaceae bacterium]
MGIFNSFFGKKNTAGEKEKNTVPWVSLTSLDQLEEIAQKSASKTQMIFKHSTTCGISRMVFNMFGKGFNFEENQIDIYYLDLHSYRKVSDEVGYRFQVAHQSPQLLVIKNRVVVEHESHGGITNIDLRKYT